jgi:Spy/CpxP family protein refolding chaperone
VGKSYDRRKELEKERDQALLSLLTPERKSQYDAILEANKAKRNDLDKERDVLMASANEKSKALLNDEQKKKWDELTKEMRDRRGSRGPRGGSDRNGPDRGGSDRGGPERGNGGPSTRPGFDAPKP